MTHPGETPIPLATGENPPVPGAVKVKVIADGTGRHQSARTKARKAALDLLFEAELRDRDAMDVLADHQLAVGAVREFTEQIVRGVRMHQEEVDRRIADCARGDWTLDRMPRIDRNLARIAVWELDHSNAPTNTVIAEAVELAEELSTDESAGFLNGLLAEALRTSTRNT